VPVLKNKAKHNDEINCAVFLDSKNITCTFIYLFRILQLIFLSLITMKILFLFSLAAF